MNDIVESTGRAPETLTIQDLLLQDRYSVLGKMTGEITHSMNNDIGAILGYSELLFMNPAAAAFQTELQIIITSVTHSSDLMRALSKLRMSLHDKVQAVDCSELLNTIFDLFSLMHKNQNLRIEIAELAQIQITNQANEFVQAVFHSINMTVRSVLEAPINKRMIAVSFTMEGDWVRLKLTIEAGKIQPIFSTDTVLPEIDDEVYDSWILNQICDTKHEWKIDDVGSSIKLNWFVGLTAN